jgi:hypothetical protein
VHTFAYSNIPQGWVQDTAAQHLEDHH